MFASKLNQYFYFVLLIIIFKINLPVINSTLTHYWPMTNLSDVVGNADLFDGYNYSFVPNRYGKVNSAIYFNHGYLRVPMDDYFSGDFSLTAWINLKDKGSHRLLDFGNGSHAFNIVISFKPLYNSYGVFYHIFDGLNNNSNHIILLNKLELNRWHHLAAVLRNHLMKIYINGSLIGSSFKIIPKSLLLPTNFIGKSNWSKDIPTNAVYSDIKLYNKALSAFQIINEYSDNVSTPAKLINYWPMSNLSDTIGNAHLSNGTNYSFVQDRYGHLNSCIYFQNGYLQVPSGVYFSSDFTITIWIKLKSYQSYSRIIDFGNGKSKDMVTIFFPEKSSKIYAGVWEDLNKESFVITSSILELNKWYHVAFVCKKNYGYIYVNGGQITSTNKLLKPNNITRESNFIGKSNSNDSHADAVYDELKIYSGSLSSSELLDDYIRGSKNVSSLQNCINNKNLMCKNNGKCELSSTAKYYCRCVKGYYGSRCESKKNEDGDWVFYTAAAIFVVCLTIIIALKFKDMKKNSNRLNAIYSADRDEIQFNRPAIFTVRSERDSDSLYSFEDAIRNSVLVTQEKNFNNTKINDFKLPSYDEYIKQNSNN